MDLVCASSNSTVCLCDWANIVVALCSLYIVVITIAFLRWNSNDRSLRTQIFRGHNLRAVCSIVLFLVHLVELAESLLASSVPSHVLHVASASLALWVPAFLLEHLLEKYSKPNLLAVTALLWFINGCARICRLGVYLNLGLPWDALRTSTAAAAATLCFCLAASQAVACRAEFKHKERTLESKSKGYQHDGAHFLSKVTFHWLTPLLRTGYKNPLEILDLGRLPSQHTTKNQYAQLSYILDAQRVGKWDAVESGTLWRCFWKFMFSDFCQGGLLKLCGDLVGLVGPLGISVVVEFVAKAGGISKSNPYPTLRDFVYNGWCMAATMLVASIAQSSFSQASTHLVNVRAIHLKGAIQTLIYTRTLNMRDQATATARDTQTLKTEETNDAEVGNITQLMSEDAFNVMSFFWVGHYIWAIPLKIFILLYLLYQKLSTSALIGAAATILIVTPLQFLIGKKMSKNASLVSEKSDERLQQISALLGGIRLLKMLAWEQFCCEKILKVRKEETDLLDEDSLYWAVLTFLTHASSILVALVTFGAYYLLQEAPLQPESVFSALALFNQLTVPLFIFPVTVPIIISAVASTRRISECLSNVQAPAKRQSPPPVQQPEDFPSRNTLSVDSIRPVLNDVKTWILQCDFPEANAENLEDVAETDSADMACMTNLPINADGITFTVQIRDGVFSWLADGDSSVRVSSMDILFGKLTIIVGKVGSGKTSLLSAMLGELYQSSGAVHWKQNTVVAYSAQTPWMLNATVRDNILFGQPFRPRRYLQVLNACALQPELEILPGKDLTEIGERGIKLSGGQKQRIAIARVLYSKANLVVLDDPLSSLDYNVALEVFENGIKRLVRREKRSVILATHHIQLLAHAHMIIAMEDGRIRAQGSLDDIESTDRELIRQWREMMTRMDTSNFQGKTAKERWQLVKLVAKMGRECRPTGVQDGNWQATETGMMPMMSASVRRRFQKFSKWKYITHDLPLPTDECEGDVLEARAQWRKTTPSIKRKTILRARSLQTRNVRTAQVVRQHSSPLIASRAHGSGSQRGLLKQLFARHSESSSDSLTMDETPTKKPVDRLLSTESGFSEAGSDTDTDELEELEYSLGGRATEDREYGQIPTSVYAVYLESCGITLAVVYLLVTLSWQGLKVATDFWLSKWTSSPAHSNISYYLYVYGVMSLGSVILSFASHAVGQCSGARARKALHDAMLLNIVRCPLRVFESTSTGRMLNRFSTDIGLIDKKISTSIQRLMQFLLLCGSAILVNAAVAPWFLVVAIPVCVVYYLVQKFYRASSRELQRLDSITRTPIFSHLTETLAGLTTIRAFGYEDKFIANLYSKIDTHTNAFLIMNSGDRWLGIVLDYLGGVIVCLAVLTSLVSATMSPSSVSPSLVGLAINYTLLVPIYLNWVVKFVADCEVYMGAVERVHQCSLQSSEEYNPHTEVAIPESWPSQGEIHFDNVTLSYGIGKEPVVFDFSLHIASGCKVGICGRSGSGKSSIALSLFNMVDIVDGVIRIDRVDVTSVPLVRLRTCISVIPQEVHLLNATLRENLDPHGQFTDQQLWNALEKAQLRTAIAAQWSCLGDEVRDGGQGLSGGQKQLFCLARAILHRSTFLVMDEATSHLDPESERILMESAKREFQGKTMLIIAHRLSTILDCDWIVVLDKGRVVEEGTPTNLLNRNMGIFSTMLRSSQDAFL